MPFGTVTWPLLDTVPDGSYLTNARYCSGRSPPECHPAPEDAVWPDSLRARSGCPQSAGSAVMRVNPRADRDPAPPLGRRSSPVWHRP